MLSNNDQRKKNKSFVKKEFWKILGNFAKSLFEPNKDRQSCCKFKNSKAAVELSK